MIATLRRLARDRYRLACSLRRGASLLEPDQNFAHLVLVAEDKRFWGHGGVDWIAALRALSRRLIGKPKGGASTIEMQFVRTLTHRRERTVRRKLREMLLAVGLGRIASKNQILATYLRVAYFGHALPGAEAAADKIYRRSVADLCLPRQALLAALLVWPLPQTRTSRWYRRAFGRARWILARADNGNSGSVYTVPKR